MKKEESQTTISVSKQTLFRFKSTCTKELSSDEFINKCLDAYIAEKLKRDHKDIITK